MYKEQAIAKLEKELKDIKSAGGDITDKKIAIVKNEVTETLKTFCNQDEEFAQAIVQTDKSLYNCLKAIMKDTGREGISDIATYKKAVNFYFAGADIKMTMEIDLIGSAAVDKPQGKVIKLSIDDLF